MWGSIAVEQHIFERLAGDAVVTAAVGDRVHVPYAPEPDGAPGSGSPIYPYVVAYRTDAMDETPAGPRFDVAAERLRYSIAAVTTGLDKRVLLRLAEAMHGALQGVANSVSVLDGEGELFAVYEVIGERVGELPTDELAGPDEGVGFVALGGVYEFDVTGG